MNTRCPNNLPQVPVPPGYALRDVQLEMSLKPFFDNSPQTREAVCREIFTQWQPLWRHAQTISILFWVAEGSEILEFDGNLDSAFEWARYHGAPNRHQWKMPEKSTSKNSDHSSIGVNMEERDPEGKGLHSRAYLYRPETAEFTYGWLRDLVSDLKRIGGEMTGRPILVGHAFDIGPEFAKSRFKYDWHREVLGDGPIFKEQFISCEAILKGDERTYAAYPEGIPEGLTIGEFLGKQIRALFDACGHDFLWLSNGFGFALEPWALVGKIFDGADYHPEEVHATRQRIMAFWTSLRTAIGTDVNIRTRGTNMATGIDIGSDASPLKQIYEENPNVDAPVNSPWAALDGDFGLELAGWMSHIAIHPGETYRFRFYTHDPWWCNSPWLDRYGRQPHDLYLPLAVSRLSGDGSAEIPRDIAFLSIDSSDGTMPVQVPNEVTAFLLKARETAPEALGPLVWVYPFDEFHTLGLEEGKPERPLHADAWIGSVINAGVPLNSVADAGLLQTVLGKKSDIISGRIFMAPVPRPGSDYETLIRQLIDAGADLLLYGPLFEESFLWEQLGLVAKEPLSGDFSLGSEVWGPSMIRHLDFLSAGGWAEGSAIADSDDDGSVYGLQGDEKRVAFRLRKSDKGASVGWLRASLTTGEFDPEDPQPIRGPILRPQSEPGFMESGDLALQVLENFGWTIRKEIAQGDRKTPYLVVHQSNNALIFSGYHRNERSAQLVRSPMGAPLLNGRHNRIVSGMTEIAGEIAWQYEVRVFASSRESGVIACRNLHTGMHGVTRRILVSGLENTSLIILPDPAFVDTLRLVKDPSFPYFLDEELTFTVETREGFTVVKTPLLNGELLIEW